MDSKVKKDLKKILATDVKNYENYSLDEEKKSKGLKVIGDEIKILHEEETHRVELTNKRKKIKLEEIKTHAQMALDEKKHGLECKKFEEQTALNVKKHDLDVGKYEHSVRIDDAKLNLDKVKFEHEKLTNALKMELEERKVKTEESKLDLEIKKFKEDILTREGEIQQRRVDRIIGIGMELLKIGLPLTIYTRLVMKNFRLVYADDGRVPSEMRDLMKNIYKDIEKLMKMDAFIGILCPVQD